jgi:integrase
VAFRDFVDAAYGQGAAFAAEPWLRAGMRLTLCGLRRSEVLGRDWRRVDLDAGTVKIRASRVNTGRGSETALGPPKSTASRRTVKAEQIHGGTTAALRALWLAQGRPESGLAICNAAGEPVSPDHYSARWRTLCQEAGVPVLRSVHNVRHSIGVALREKGVPEHHAAGLLGHDVPTFLKFYLVTDDDAAAEGAEAAGQVFA